MDAVQNDLRQRLARRQQEKAELEQRLHAVQHRYQEEVAPLEEEVLRVQMERLREAAQRNMRSARHRNAYHDAQRAYETFREERVWSPAGTPASDLKEQYRRASKRCHPDVVPEAYREQAAGTFQALESAYQAGHAQAVRAIADDLERWGFPTAPHADDHEGTPEGTDLRQAVSDLESAIESIRRTDAYQAVAQAEDVDALLRAKKKQLLQHLRRVRQ